MPRIPGLVPDQTTQGQRTALRGRVSTPDASNIRPVQLQAVAAPVDTFARAAQPAEDRNMMDLASALADLNPSLTKFMDNRTKEPVDTAAKARALIQQTDPAELAERIKAGDVPAEFQNLEGMRVYAENRAYADSQAIFTKYNADFDRMGGDVDALFREGSADAFEQFGQDRAFLDVYTQTMEKSRQRLLAESADYRTSETLVERKDMVFNTWANRVTTMTAEGTPPGDIVQTLFDDIPKNRDFLQLHPKEQQAMLLQIADQQATAGNYDIAKTILQTTRTDGDMTGSLLTDNDLGQKSTDLLARIEADQLKASLLVQSQQAEQQVMVDASQMVTDGTILGVTDATVPGPDGQPKTIPAETILKDVANREVETIRAEAASRNATPEQARLWEVQRFVGSGLEHPVWFRNMKAAYTQMSVNTATGTNIPPTAMDAYTTYRDLYTHSPAYLSKHMDQASLDFYQTASILEESGLADSPEDALRQTMLVTQRIDMNDPSIRQKFTEIDTAINGIIRKSSGWFDGNVDASNNSQIRDDVVKSATLFARAGLGNEEALKAATDLYKKTHVNVMGTYLKADKRMPGDFAPLVDAYVTGFVEQYGEAEGIELGDVTIMEVGNGTGGYFIADRATRQPIIVDDMSWSFTLNTLTELRAQRRLDVMQPVIDNQNVQQDTPPPAPGSDYVNRPQH